MGQSIDYIAEAERNYELALQGAASTVPQIKNDNRVILYTGAVFIFICSLARGPQAGEYLAFRDDGSPGCLSLFLGVRSILETCTALSLDVSNSHAGQPQSADMTFNTPEDVEGAEASQLGQFYPLVNSTYALQDTGYGDYLSVLDRLREAYRDVLSPSKAAHSHDYFPLVFRWLYTLPDTFIMDLQSRQPLALIILGFFAVLLKEVDSTWFLSGWPEHLIDNILNHLDEYHRQFIVWPVTEIVRGRP